MGLDSHSIRFLLTAQATEVSFERVLTIGRQNFRLRAPELRRCFQQCRTEIPLSEAQRLLTETDGYSESLLRWLGAKEIDSMDASVYEGATIIHDLNVPIASTLQNRFTAVIDGGSLEHVFNFPMALKNCLEMVREGGHFIAISPANNWFGHGFYQFSPELFFRCLTPLNGFEIQRIFVCESPPRAAWYAVMDPADVGRCGGLVSFRQTSVLVQAKRMRVVPVLLQSPQQSDYASTWGGMPPSRNPHILKQSRLRTFLACIAHRLGPRCQQWLRGWVSLFFPYWMAAESFHKVNLDEYCARLKPNKPGYISGS